MKTEPPKAVVIATFGVATVIVGLLLWVTRAPQIDTRNVKKAKKKLRQQASCDELYDAI